MKTYKEEVEKPRLVIEHDDCVENPRLDSPLGYFVTVERNRFSPDNDEELVSLVTNTGDESESVEEHMQKIKTEMKHNGYGDVVYITPINRYEHGSVVYRRKQAFGFDYSNCGFYIVTDKTLKDGGYNSLVNKKEFDEVIDTELEDYTHWVNGDLYRFTLYDEEGNEIDSCGNFHEIEAIKDNLPEEWKDEDLTDYVV